MKKILATAILCVLTLNGCAAFNAHPIHPGAVDKYDSAAYDVLLVYNDAINGAKADLAAGTFPVAIKPALNKLIDGYDVLQAAVTTYHKSTVAGTATPDLLQTMLNAESTAAAAYAEFVKLYPKGGSK
jgi:hypothetical protein